MIGAAGTTKQQSFRSPPDRVFIEVFAKGGKFEQNEELVIINDDDVGEFRLGDLPPHLGALACHVQSIFAIKAASAAASSSLPLALRRRIKLRRTATSF